MTDAPVFQGLRGRRAGVTGGFGALGRVLVPKLLASGASHVTVLDRHACAPASMAGLPVTHVPADIRDAGACRRLAEESDLIVHLAGVPHVGEAQSEPGEAMDVNVTGTARLMDACRGRRARQVLFASTGQVYGLAAGAQPMAETTLPRPHTLYAATKLAAETIVGGYAGAFGLAGVIVRLANLYGAGASADTVIGRALRHAVRGEALSFTSVTPVRDFVTLSDAADGLCRLAGATAGQAGALIVNLASGQGTSVKTMAEQLAEIVASDGAARPEIRVQEPPSMDPVPVLVLDPARLRALTGWAPSTPLAHGLRDALRELTGRAMAPAAA